jgi:hypothetical protein
MAERMSAPILVRPYKANIGARIFSVPASAPVCPLPLAISEMPTPDPLYSVASATWLITSDPLLTVANDRYRAPDIGNSQELVTPKMVVAQRSNYEMAAISVSSSQFSFST